jgi:predicted DNA-binding transcriptional regulator YafY
VTKLIEPIDCAGTRGALQQAISEHQSAFNRRSDMKTEVTFTYKNYRGETSVRLVRPVMVSFGTTGFHPEPQWLLHAWDVNKDAERTFAMKDIRDWDPAP